MAHECRKNGNGALDSIKCEEFWLAYKPVASPERFFSTQVNIAVSSYFFTHSVHSAVCFRSPLLLSRWQTIRSTSALTLLPLRSYPWSH